jgi:hypothetical protein
MMIQPFFISEMVSFQILTSNSNSKYWAQGHKVELQLEAMFLIQGPPMAIAIDHSSMKVVDEGPIYIISSTYKIADLKEAVRVDEKVGRFQVPVQHVGGVDVLEGPKNLVDKVLEMP